MRFPAGMELAVYLYAAAGSLREWSSLYIYYSAVVRAYELLVSQAAANQKKMYLHSRRESMFCCFYVAYNTSNNLIKMRPVIPKRIS